MSIGRILQVGYADCATAANPEGPCVEHPEVHGRSTENGVGVLSALRPEDCWFGTSGTCEHVRHVPHGSADRGKRVVSDVAAGASVRNVPASVAGELNAAGESTGSGGGDERRGRGVDDDGGGGKFGERNEKNDGQAVGQAVDVRGWVSRRTMGRRR